MPRPPKQLGNLTYEQKRHICEWFHKHLTLSQRELADKAKCEFELFKAPSQGTISNILRNQNKFLRARDEDLQCKRARVLAHPAVDDALTNWVLQCQAKRISLIGDLVKEKDRRLEQLIGTPDDQRLSFSNGWLHSFQGRHGLRSFKTHGESGSVDEEALPRYREVLRDQLRGKALADIYNMDETGLFYCLAPDRSIAQRQIDGVKKSKMRVTVALTCNADGSDLREPFIIGHANKPRCFSKKTGADLGFYYRSNMKAWMTGVLFQEWLREFDTYMHQQRRSIVLLLDNASCHIVGNLQLKAITVLFLPPNCTSRLQPLDAGIIATFKRRYRHRQLEHALDMDEAGTATDIYKVDQLTAMRWLKSCWRDIPSRVVLNCFRHTELIPGRTSRRRSQREKDEMLRGSLAKQMQRLRIRDPMDIDEFVCHPGEAVATMKVLSNEELLGDCGDAAFVASALCDSDDTNEDLETEVHEDPLAALTTTDKTAAIRSVIFMLTEHPDVEMKVLSGLRTLQERLWKQQREEQE